MRIEDGQKSPQNKFIDLKCSFIQFRCGSFACGYDGKVVADFGRVKDSFGRCDAIVVDNPFRVVREFCVERRV